MPRPSDRQLFDPTLWPSCDTLVSRVQRLYTVATPSFLALGPRQVYARRTAKVHPVRDRLRSSRIIVLGSDARQWAGSCPAFSHLAR